MHNNPSVNGSLALKLDISKAYDMVKWGFLDKVMRKMGFRDSWVDMTMECVRSPTFSFVINGEPRGKVYPSRGLIQGDPISPYLFLLCADVFSNMLIKAANQGSNQGYKVCADAPPVSHLFFADDSLIFCKAEEGQVHAMLKIIKDYEYASGQRLNKQKTTVSYSKGVQPNVRQRITSLLNVKEVAHQDKYLGLPNYVGKSKKKPFLEIKERICQKIQGWMEKLLSWSGREVLLKAVAQAIPTYAMSVFRIPQALCDEIQAALGRFWWGHDEKSRKIHWLS